MIDRLLNSDSIVLAAFACGGLMLYALLTGPVAWWQFPVMWIGWSAIELFMTRKART